MKLFDVDYYKIIITLIVISLSVSFSLLGTELTSEQNYELRKSQSFGREKKRQKKYRQSIGYLQNVIKIDPDFKVAKPIVCYWLGQCYESLEQRDSALVFYEKYQKLNPAHENVLRKLAYYYGEEKEFDKAADIAKILLNKNTQNFELMKEIGDYYFQWKKGNYKDSALVWYKKYLKKNPGDKNVSQKLVFLMEKSSGGDKLDLQKKYERMLKSNPEDLLVLKKLGRIYYKNGRKELAGKLLSKVYEKSEADLEIIKMLLNIFSQNEEKLEQLNISASKLAPENDRFDKKLAMIYLNKREFRKARKYCLSVLAKNPEAKDIYKIWGDIYVGAVLESRGDVDYQDKLVYLIALGLYEKGGEVRMASSLKLNNQIPSKSDFFINKKNNRLQKKNYSWIDKNWNEVKFIDKYLQKLNGVNN